MRIVSPLSWLDGGRQSLKCELTRWPFFTEPVRYDSICASRPSLFDMKTAVALENVIFRKLLGPASMGIQSGANIYFQTYVLLVSMTDECCFSTINKETFFR